MVIDRFPCIVDMRHRDGDIFECCLTGERMGAWYGERGRGYESFGKAWFKLVKILAYLDEEEVS